VREGAEPRALSRSRPLSLSGRSLSLWNGGSPAMNSRRPGSARRRKAPYEAGGEVVSLWWRRMAFGGHGQDPQTVPAPAPFPAKGGTPARHGGRR
jgi:hypothetical protein